MRENATVHDIVVRVPVHQASKGAKRRCWSQVLWEQDENALRCHEAGCRRGPSSREPRERLDRDSAAIAAMKSPPSHTPGLNLAPSPTHMLPFPETPSRLSLVSPDRFSNSLQPEA